jgi:Flp pilus assembly protein TadB
MLPFSLTSFLKYLIGILLAQGVTVLLVVTAYRTDLEKTGLLFLALNMAIGALTAFWFTSMAEGTRKQALSRAKESFAREREKIRVRAEQEKTKEAKSSRRRIDREKRRAQKGTNLKTGVMLGGAAGVGVFMVLTQFVTLGLLTLTTAGGAALGYGLRARQERLGFGGRLLPRGDKAVKVIESKTSAGAIEAREMAPKTTGEG